MSHYRMPILDETGYVVLDSHGGVMNPSEWQSLEYVDWKSSGDTRFAPIASAHGEIECNGFWRVARRGMRVILGVGQLFPSPASAAILTSSTH